MINTKGVFTTKDAPPVALAAALMKEFGESWLTWDPAVIWDEIKDTLGVEIDEDHRDAVMALRLCVLTHVPWQDWHPFLAVAMALNGDSIDSDSAEPCNIAQLAYAVDLMRRLKPDQEFEPEVKSMAAIILWEAGICWVPSYPLGDLVNDELLSMQKSDEQRLMVSFMAKDYLADDGLDAMDDYDAVRIHTIKLRAIDLYLSLRHRLEKEMSA